MTTPTGASGQTVIVLVVVVLLAGCSAVSDLPVDVEFSNENTGESVQVVVDYIIDGDTIAVVFPDGTEDTVRLLGVDAPEVSGTTPQEFEGVPDTEAGCSCLRMWGDRASTYLQNELAGRMVTLQFDPLADRRGYYGRLLAYVVVGNTTINKELIAEGYARLYDSTFEARTTYATLEQQAQSTGEGLWTCQNPAEVHTDHLQSNARTNAPSGAAIRGMRTATTIG